MQAYHVIWRRRPLSSKRPMVYEWLLRRVAGVREGKFACGVGHIICGVVSS